MAASEPTMWEDVVAALESLPTRPLPRRGTDGARIPRPVAAGRVDTTSYLTASLGPPRWLERLQEIEGYRREAESRLRLRWTELAVELRDRPAAFAERWREITAGWDFAAHNELVERHNEYYPAERKLRFDLRRRDYVDMWGIGWRRTPLDATWALQMFPPTLELAVAAIDDG
ncbi:MAG: hypothetical protein ACTHNU_11465 [Gaiellales bacterium]